MLQQILSVWSALPPQRRVVVALATVAMFAAVLVLSRMASTPGMSLLYSGLEAGPAGEVISALEQRGTRYEVRGGAIYVNRNERDELRMTLASEGLPANNAAGYELLDSLSGFGTTSQMFDAAYWRAKEGELARTIASSPQVRAARVHISNPSSQPFRRDLKPTASVTVTPTAGSLSAGQARALKNLIASAVAGLSPEDVSVIDGQSGQILGADEFANGAGNGDDRAAELKQAVERLLAARVGYGNSVVEVSLETVTDRESIVERVFDPDSRVAISTDTEERTTSAEDAQGGGVTVASNLPEGDENGSAGSSTSQNSETRERVNFEVSETQREILRVPGAIKRLTVAVLVDGTTSIDAAGTEVFTPRSADELATLRELVASAVGFDEARGDVITLKSLAFEPVEAEGTAADASLTGNLNLDPMFIIQLAVLSVVILVLGLFVVRPILTSAPALAAGALPAPASRQSEGIGNQPSAVPSLPALTGEIDNSGFAAPTMAVVSDFDFPDENSGLPAMSGSGGRDPVKRLRELIEERQDETVEILRSWMEDSEGTA